MTAAVYDWRDDPDVRALVKYAERRTLGRWGLIMQATKMLEVGRLIDCYDDEETGNIIAFRDGKRDLAGDPPTAFAKAWLREYGDRQQRALHVKELRGRDDRAVDNLAAARALWRRMVGPTLQQEKLT